MASGLGGVGGASRLPEGGGSGGLGRIGKLGQSFLTVISGGGRKPNADRAEGREWTMMAAADKADKVVSERKRSSSGDASKAFGHSGASPDSEGVELRDRSKHPAGGAASGAAAGLAASIERGKTLLQESGLGKTWDDATNKINELSSKSEIEQINREVGERMLSGFPAGVREKVESYAKENKRDLFSPESLGKIADLQKRVEMFPEKSRETIYTWLAQAKHGDDLLDPVTLERKIVECSLGGRVSYVPPPRPNPT